MYYVAQEARMPPYSIHSLCGSLAPIVQVSVGGSTDLSLKVRVLVIVRLNQT